MSYSFKKIVEDEYTQRVQATAPIKEVDAITFVTSSKYLDEKPFPFQSLVIKLMYGLWKKYPISADEQKILNILRENWGINIDLKTRDLNQFVEILILVVGRRGTKTSLISYIQTYETYKLICKGNPQKYYGIRPRHTIEIVNCLTKNSYITLENGHTKQITKLKANDVVLSVGEHGVQTSRVKDVWCSGEKDVLEIKTDNKTIEASLGHKFYKLLPETDTSRSRKSGWIPASKLKKGDYIGILTKVPNLQGNTSPHETDKKFKNRLLPKGMEWAKIRSIKSLGKQVTYDVEIENTHNFFANGVFVHNCAKDGEQAKSPFMLTKDNIKRIPFFQPYIDHTKDNESELRLFTPADVYENKKIFEYNENRPKGSLKKNFLEGSILISAVTTSAASKRGKAIINLCFDEFAHFDRAKITSGGITDQDILTEMPQTDYAMFKAITPSVKDFGKDGKILCISSPREKGGEFYKLYCEAGGREQHNPDSIIPNPEYLMLQLASWEANPNRPKEQFTGNFKKDPVGANMEYGAHFSDPSSTFIDSVKVDAMIDVTKRFTTEGIYGYGYIITVDPASKGDTYAIAWGHCEENRGNPQYHIDGLFGFRPPIVIVDGKQKKMEINPEKVTNFIVDLAASITRTGGHILEICYDQWNSVSCIFKLQKLNYPAFETMFTNPYKGKIYGDFLEKLNINQIKCYGAPPKYSEAAFKLEYFDGWVEQAKLEIKYLQQDVQGNATFYHAPTSGPVTTDDFADVISNLVHRLALRRSPDAKTMRELYKQTGRPVKTNSGIKPSLGSTGFFTKGSLNVNIRNRVFGGRK